MLQAISYKNYKTYFKVGTGKLPSATTEGGKIRVVSSNNNLAETKKTLNS